MYSNLTEPKTFFITGMPRGGTTIVARVFDSLTDGFCLGEPHWYHYHNEDMECVKTNCFGKVPDASDDIHTLLPDIESYLLKNGVYNVGGYKETYFWGNPLAQNLILDHRTQVDFYIVVLRDPRMVFTSMSDLGWRVSKNRFLRCYKELDVFARNGIVVVYEDFVKDPLGYLNERLPFKIEGELELVPTTHKYGDPYANRSTKIEMSKRVATTAYKLERATEIWRSHLSA